MHRSIEEVLLIPIKDTVTIGALFRDQREMELKNIVQSELILFADLISTSNNISVTKAMLIAEKFLAIPQVKNLRIEELKFFFEEAFNFRYGKLYGGFGWDVLREWFEIYWKERTSTAVNIQLDKHSRNTAGEKEYRTLSSGERFGAPTTIKDHTPKK